VKLSSNHVSSGQKETINMAAVRILDRVEDGFFTNPSRGLGELK
jgi:hypothetical protein